MDPALRIGTSGWHYKHWKGDFYPAGLANSKMFEWYSQHFNTVELNNSFYRLPTEEAFLAWRDRAPLGFTFAVKASRFITHMKKLKDPELAVDKFFDRVLLLEEKLGPILFQLPPGWAANIERLRDFLRVIPRGPRYVFEFRDESWHHVDVYRVLRKHNVALCLHDWRAVPGPIEITADFTYVRMHGPSGEYHGSYDEGTLQEWADRLQRWRRELAAAYVYFNNDQGGHAIRNALALERMLQTRAAA